MAARKTASGEDAPVRAFATQDAFEDWMSSNAGAARGVWVKFAKSTSGRRSIKYAEAVEVALCWGWIDGQARRLDETWYLQKFTPRTARSLWSRINCGKATALIEAGKMRPAGLVEVERAKKDGRWTRAYDSPSRATVPDDLAAALARNSRASAFFDGLDSRNRYAILHRVQIATKADTRARRIAEFVKMLSRREKIYP